LELLTRHFRQQSFILLEGFWPSSNYGTSYECASIPIVEDVDPENLVIPPYCDPRSMCLSLNTIAYMFFVICLLVILFLCDIQTLQSILCGWEGLKMML
jgi:hypothetical protein